MGKFYWPAGSSRRHQKLGRRVGMRVGPSIRYGPLDRLFSRYIRQRDKVCQRCGRAGGRLEAAHMFSRAKKSAELSLWQIRIEPNES